MTRIVLEKLTKLFGNFTAVKDLSLEVKDNEFLGLLGPSGCGKSTILYCIAGLESPTSGKIHFDGKEVNALAPEERGVGLVFQNYALFLHMAVYDNLAFSMKMKGADASQIRTEVKAMADYLQISGLLDRRASTLSLPQMQKVALGRTLLSHPKVLLLDEPLSALDAQSRQLMRAELKRLQKEVGQTAIFVTHDQQEAMALSDRVAVMNGGRLQHLGRPEEIYGHPPNTFVASFIGSPQINLINGTVQKKNGKLIIDADDWSFEIGQMNHHVKLNESQRVQVGVRPEHVAVHENSGRSTGSRGTVFLMEPLGSEVILHIKVGRQTLKAISEKEIPSGKSVHLDFDEERLLFFDKDSGQAIV